MTPQIPPTAIPLRNVLCEKKVIFVPFSRKVIVGKRLSLRHSRAAQDGNILALSCQKRGR
jgi:hypothetical protein